AFPSPAHSPRPIRPRCCAFSKPSRTSRSPPRAMRFASPFADRSPEVVSDFLRFAVYTCMRPSYPMTAGGDLMRAMVLATLVSCAIVSLASAQGAHAAIRKPTNIPAQALRPALQLLSKERDMQVVYRTDVVADLRTAGAVGDLTSDEALKQ